MPLGERSSNSTFSPAGYEPIDIAMSDPRWRETFLRPRDAHGTIVQIVESCQVRASVAEMLRELDECGPDALRRHVIRGEGQVWWTQPRVGGPPAAIRRITLETANVLMCWTPRFYLPASCRAAARIRRTRRTSRGPAA